ncbi:hypothetical protein [Actinomadura rupiterrae]|uniref:hypothetical protein n=1 Tax=Actinomadura rupiterrae TaxID=559627 RepID=UPI0020A5BBCF|nr:hypothetical protein [Actinomadura rupiterrae]MCP2337326.1 hypothetical protein [Actinomadura rupiterrae]
MSSSNAPQPLPDPSGTDELWMQLKSEFPTANIVPASGGSWLGQIPADPTSPLLYHDAFADSADELRARLLDMTSNSPADREEW